MNLHDAAMLRLMQNMDQTTILRIPGVIEHLSAHYKASLKQIEQKLSWCDARAWDGVVAQPETELAPKQIWRAVPIVPVPSNYLDPVDKSSGKKVGCVMCGAKRRASQAKYEACSCCRQLKSSSIAKAVSSKS